eukprot:m.312012 g.312012  ORF g.312012 m.312012 type:complete len:59 (-) comp20233_c0_seq15:151-327(-)
MYIRTPTAGALSCGKDTWHLVRWALQERLGRRCRVLPVVLSDFFEEFAQVFLHNGDHF